MMMKYILLITMIACCMVSCNDWLDVRPETEQKDKDQFSSVGGFYDALTGCYMTLADKDAYGERLTMSNIESLSNLWYMPEDRNTYERVGDWDLTHHNYTTDASRAAIKAFYGRLFNAIAQANMIIRYAESQGHVFTDTTALAVVKGEAYAIRALCQFDVLRLFGQMPKKPSKLVELPYSHVTGIDDLPLYYGYADYVQLLKSDLTQAESLLKENDPVFKYTFEELNKNAAVADPHLLYRQSRLNYWAVRALRARVHLYLDETGDAYRVAKEIITAQGPDGAPLMRMSGAEDFAKGYKLCPSECLFYLSKHDVKAQCDSLLIGGRENAQFSNELVMTAANFNAMYAGENLQSHNRYKNCWNEKIRSMTTANAYVATTKYYFDDKVKDKTLYYQLIPMLRMSEMYLIGMETSPSLPEVNAWFKEYMVAHEVGDSRDFSGMDEVRKWLIAEYRREFVVEGQAFYTYKRTGTTGIPGRTEPVGENGYVLPLPETEFNPNNLK